MTWEIFLGIAALVGFVASIAKIVANNTQAMTEVKCGLDELKDALSAQKAKTSGMQDQLNDHETRLVIIEHK